MAKRTYLPTLRYVCKKVCDYINDWYPLILKFLPPEKKPLLDDALDACAALVAALDIIIDIGG